MFAVVGLHGSLKGGQSAMYILVNGNVDFCRGSPDDNDAVAGVFGFEAADVFAEGFHHVPAGLAVFHVVTVETLGIVAVESGGDGFDGFQFVGHRIDILLFEHLGVDGTLIGIGRINIPGAKDNILQVGERYNLAVVQIFLVFASTDTDFVVLSH